MCQDNQKVGRLLQEICVDLGNAIDHAAQADDSACPAVHQVLVMASRDIMDAVRPLVEFAEAYCKQYDVDPDIIREFNAKHHKVIDELGSEIQAAAHPNIVARPSMTVVNSIDDLMRMLGIDPSLVPPDEDEGRALN